MTISHGKFAERHADTLDLFTHTLFLFFGCGFKALMTGNLNSTVKGSLSSQCLQSLTLVGLSMAARLLQKCFFQRYGLNWQGMELAGSKGAEFPLKLYAPFEKGMLYCLNWQGMELAGSRGSEFPLKLYAPFEQGMLVPSTNYLGKWHYPYTEIVCFLYLFSYINNKNIFFILQSNN